MADSLPDVAPHDACVVCFKGDTTTGLAIEGDADFLATGFLRLGVPPDQIEGCVLVAAQEFYGCEWGKVPAAMLMRVAVCPECAAKAGLPVEPLSGNIPHYHQDTMFPDGLPLS